MPKFILGALLAVCTAASGLAQSHSYEETVVRQTYAKMSYLSEIGRISEAAFAPKAPTREALRQTLSDETVRFQLTHFTVGDISDISSTPWSSLVSQKYKMANVLSLSLDSQTYTEGATKPVHWLQVDVAWSSARIDNVDGNALAWLNSPVSTFLAAPGFGVPGATYTRYAAFTVTSSFEGKSNGPYSAMFLFGKDEKGNAVVTPEDLGVIGSAIVGVSNNDTYPYGLLRTSLREKPAVADWLSTATVSGGSCVQRQLCCTGDRCALRSVDVQQELRIPLNLAPVQ